MGKLLSWVVLAIAGWLAWRLVGVVQRKLEAARREAAERGAAGQGPGAGAGREGAALRDERIVPCAHCGVHFPASEAVERGGRLYCCPEHRDADERAA
jgi:uncharacterized protein